MTKQEFIDYVIGQFFSLSLANYDNGLSIADNVITFGLNQSTSIENTDT